jgi:hypothetical protein
VPRPLHDRRPFIFTMIAIAGLLFVATEALLYYRWATMSEPNSVLLVNAGAALKDAEISVDSIELAKPLRATVGVNDRYSIPFYVNPGTYDVRLKMAGEEQFHGSITVAARTMRTIDLTKLVPTTTPSTLPAAPAF